MLEPRSHRGSARDRKSEPAMTEPESTDKPPEAGIDMPWFSFLWETWLTRDLAQPRRER